MGALTLSRKEEADVYRRIALLDFFGMHDKTESFEEGLLEMSKKAEMTKRGAPPTWSTCLSNCRIQVLTKQILKRLMSPTRYGKGELFPTYCTGLLVKKQHAVGLSIIPSL